MKGQGFFNYRELLCRADGRTGHRESGNPDLWPELAAYRREFWTHDFVKVPSSWSSRPDRLEFRILHTVFERLLVALQFGAGNAAQLRYFCLCLLLAAER